MVTAGKAADHVNLSIQSRDALVGQAFRPVTAFAPGIGLRIEFRHKPVRIPLVALAVLHVVPGAADQIDLAVDGDRLLFIAPLWQ